QAERPSGTGEYSSGRRSASCRTGRRRRHGNGAVGIRYRGRKNRGPYHSDSDPADDDGSKCRHRVPGFNSIMAAVIFRERAYFKLKLREGGAMLKKGLIIVFALLGGFTHLY